jgi:hypothetical protein
MIRAILLPLITEVPSMFRGWTVCCSPTLVDS